MERSVVFLGVRGHRARAPILAYAAFDLKLLFQGSLNRLHLLRIEHLRRLLVVLYSFASDSLHLLVLLAQIGWAVGNSER